MENNLFCLACVCILLPAWAEAEPRSHWSEEHKNAWTIKAGLVLDVGYTDLNRSSFQLMFKGVEDYFAMNGTSLLEFAQICAPDWTLRPEVHGDYIDGIEVLDQLKGLIASNDEYQNLDFVFLLTRKGIQVTYMQGIHFMRSYFEVKSRVCQNVVPVIVSAVGNVEEIGREIARTLIEVMKVGNQLETQKQCLPIQRVLKCCEWAQICVFLNTHCKWRPKLCSVAWAKPCVPEK